MLTCGGREHLLHKGIEYYDKQDYPDKELIIIGDDFGIPTIGGKRNLGVSMASGEIICMMDDDDYYASGYLSHAVRHLNATNANITGLSSAYFYHFRAHLLWLYEYKGQQPYVIESGMMFRREVWERQQFPNISSGEGLQFQCNAGKISAHGYIDGFMAMIHGGNTASHKHLSMMRRINPDIAEDILKENYYFYSSVRAAAFPPSSKVGRTPPNKC